jgi:hypothetical protein
MSSSKAQKGKGTFSPEWNGDFHLQALSIALKFEWRTRPDKDLDDLMNEAHFKFFQIKSKLVDNPAPGKKPATRSYFANTFHRSLVNLYLNFAKQRSRRARKHVGVGGTDMLEALSKERRLDPRLSEVEVRDLLRSARKDVVLHRVVKQLVTGEFKMRPLVHGPRRPGYVRREDTDNEFLCRVAKVGPEIDMVRLVMDWIHGDASVAC